MNFSPNKTPIEIVKEGAFGGNYFRGIYSGINDKWYKNSWKEFDQLKNIDTKFYVLIFQENKAYIKEIDPYGWFQWYFRHWLGRRSKDDERQINRQK